MGAWKNQTPVNFVLWDPREECHKVTLKSKMGRQQFFFLFSDDFIWNDSTVIS